VNAYSIKDLEKLSGIKAHTLRIWEQRYGIVKPKRTPTNIRYYLDQDLAKLLNVVFLYKNGVKISRIAQMSDQEIEEFKSNLAEKKSTKVSRLDALILATTELDEQTFNKILAEHSTENGFFKTMTELIYPFMDKLSVLWLTGSITPSRELFVSNLIRQKVITSIDKETTPPNKKQPKFILFLPDGETQELGLLFLHFILKSKSFPVLYLGKNIQIDQISDACQFFHPDYLFTILSDSLDSSPFLTWINKMNEEIPNTKLILSGATIQTNDTNANPNLILLKDLKATLSYLDQIIFKVNSFQLN
jgi:MerR family transcriptional regulator, light-induced transcriptional regulator